MADRLDEYFVDEAGDFLGQLQLLLADPGWPDADELLRLTTGVRGSTEMAGAETVSRVATALDDGARAVAEGQIGPNSEILEAVRETALELRYLLAAIHDWGADEDERAERCLALWSALIAASEDGSAAATGRAARSEPHRAASTPRSSEEIPVIPIGLLAVDEEPLRTVPIAALLSDLDTDEGAPTVPVGSLEFDGPAEDGPIVTVEALEPGEATEGLSPLPIEALFRDEATPSGESADLPVVAIADLLLPDDGDAPVVPVEALLLEAEEISGVIPIESLLLEDDVSTELSSLAAVPIESLLDTVADEVEVVAVDDLPAEEDEPVSVVPVTSLLSGEIELLELVPVESLLSDDEPVLAVPIDSLLADEESGEPKVVPVESLLIEDDTEPVAEPIDEIVLAAAGSAVVAAVVAGIPGADVQVPVDLPPLVPVDALFPEDDEAPAIPVGSLLLRGDSAIRQALALRSAIETAARGEPSGEQSLPELVGELFDLLELSLVADAPEA